MKNYGSEWKKRIKAGEFIHGGHMFIPNPSLAEAMAYFGFECIWIDGEHGAYDKGDILASIVAVNAAGAGAFVRVSGHDPSSIKPILDMGPNGIVCPNVVTVEEAAAFISACTYPPKGIRGFGPQRALRYGSMNIKEYLETVDDSLVKIIQIEHYKAVEDIDRILEVPGLDAVTVGPFDLSGSMDLLGQVMHTDVLAACKRIVERCKAHKIPIGPSLGVGNIEFLKFWMDLKIDYVFYGDDRSSIKLGVESAIATVKEKMG